MLSSRTNMLECIFVESVLYQLETCHPTIDFVGYLKSCGHGYLVFIQISISKYVRHSKLSEIISRPPPPSYKSEDIHLFQYYCSRCCNLYTGKLDVLFLYITTSEAPKEVINQMKYDLRSFDHNHASHVTTYVGSALHSLFPTTTVNNAVL